MNKIITLTVNPVLDKNTKIFGFKPNQKLSCSPPNYYPGGGGINVSRAIRNLGGTSHAICLVGGRIGHQTQRLLNQNNIPCTAVVIEGLTRENLTVTDEVTNLQYRFSMPGPTVRESEWQKCLEQLEKMLSEGNYLVASGKLPPGIPDNFYARVAAIADHNKAKLILDTKGKALSLAVKANLFLCKPNLAELSALCGVSSISFLKLETMVNSFMQNHSCKVMVVSMGARGALLATADGIDHIPAPVVHEKNLVGAGDSMVAGMVLALLANKSFYEMALYGVACGTAATLSSEPRLCAKADVDALYQWLKLKTKGHDP